VTASRWRSGVVGAFAAVVLAAGVVALVEHDDGAHGSVATRAVESSTTTSTTAATTTTSTTTTTAPPATTAPTVPPTTARPRVVAPATTARPAPATTVAPPTTVVPSGSNDDNVAGQVLAAMNRDRAANGGAPALQTTPCLANLAAGWAQTMSLTQSMVHNPLFAACNGLAAENIGRWTPCSAAAMEDWWMSSPDHRAHLLAAKYGTAGVGVFRDGAQCWFVVDFGP
jgi:uncharacterized protein YkwD